MEQNNKKYSVIMVDDEIWALRGLMGIINWEQNGFEIKGTFTDSRKALDEILNTRPDIIFTDIRMPDIDGIELIRTIRENGLDSRIVIVTAYEDFEIARMALKSNVSDYLIKPLSREDVKNTAAALYEQLSKDNVTEKHLTDFDLSKKESYLEPLVAQEISRFFKPGIQVVISERPLKAETALPIYISDYPYSYLAFSPDFDTLSNNEKHGVSTPISAKENLIEHIKEAQMSYDGGFEFSDNETIANIQKFLYENMDKKLNLEQIASHFYLSKPYVHELFRNNTDTSAMNFLKEVRLTRAAYYLSTKKANVREVALMVGYDDPGYFSKQFKSKFGCTPEGYAAKSVN